MTKITYSKYQIPIFDWVKNGDGNALIQAVAGSGKTTLIVEAVNIIPPTSSILFLAFNTSIVKELEEKIKNKNVQIKTSHSLGYGLIREYYPNVTFEEYKYHNYFKNNFAQLTTNTEIKDIKDIKKFKENVLNLLGLARVYLCRTKEDIFDVGKKYDYSFIDNEPEVILSLIEWGINNLDEIDYTDMVSLPSYLNLQPKRYLYDFVLVDECQDQSIAMQSLFRMVIKPNGRFIAVGDESQCINTFAGSDIDSFNKIAQIPNTTTFPLSICYRCPKVIEPIAQKYVSNFEVKENAIEGKIDYSVKVNQIKDGSMVLCRNTAPLVSLYMRLLSQNIKSFIKGKDIGENLVKMIEKTEQPFLNMDLKNNGVFTQLYKNLFKTRDDIMKDRGLGFTEATLTSTVMYIYDIIEALKVLSENINTSYELIKQIREVFSDSNETDGIILSTIHKSKGLEAENVYLLCPSLIPSKYAEKDWEVRSEQNLEYVMYTRTKNLFGYISEYDFPATGGINDTNAILAKLTTIESIVHNSTPEKREIKQNDKLYQLNKKKKEIVKEKKNLNSLDNKTEENIDSSFIKRKQMFEKILVGKSYNKAYDILNNFGFINTIRVIIEDGQNMIITEDFVPDRINIEVKDNIIVDIVKFG